MILHYFLFIVSYSRRQIQPFVQAAIKLRIPINFNITCLLLLHSHLVSRCLAQTSRIVSLLIHVLLQLIVLVSVRQHRLNTIVSQVGLILFVAFVLRDKSSGRLLLQKITLSENCGLYDAMLIVFTDLELILVELWILK